ncbi:hypothetical protein IKQ21_05390 [bacterium]|nr:hypothetical protein [bacterium]
MSRRRDSCLGFFALNEPTDFAFCTNALWQKSFALCKKSATRENAHCIRTGGLRRKNRDFENYFGAKNCTLQTFSISLKFVKLPDLIII